MTHLKPVISILLLFWTFTANAQNPGTKDINTLYKEGLQAYKAKNYKVYLEKFKTLDQLRPNHPVILYNLAGAYALNKQEKPSFQCLERLIPINANPKIAKDDDFAYLRSYKSFKHILEKIKRLHQPVSNSSVAFTFPEREIHPESIAYDPVKKKFYLSSVRQRKIFSFDSDGKLQDFTTSGQDGLDAVLGIKTDPAKRLLWASSNAMPYMKGYKKEDKGRTAVFKYHLDTGKLIKKYTLNDGPDHGFDDVSIHPGGDLYISDTRNIYRIDQQTDKLSPLLESNSFRSIQGIVFCGGGKFIIAADWSSGLFLVDIEKKKISATIKPPRNTSLRGIDGLYYLPDDNSLLAIQNGITPFRVTRFFLDESFRAVTGVQTIERATAYLDEPTLGVMTPDREFYYVANSPWGHYTKDFKPVTPDNPRNIIILKTRIPK